MELVMLELVRVTVNLRHHQWILLLNLIVELIVYRLTAQCTLHSTVYSLHSTVTVS
jgi:hypothetical protein